MTGTYTILTPELPAALSVVRLVGPNVAALFERPLPGPNDAPKLNTMRDVDTGLLRAGPDNSFLFTPHGGPGVLQALRLAMQQAGFEPLDTPSADPDFARGMNRYQREALGLLSQARSPGQAAVLIAAMNAEPPKPGAFNPRQFLADWVLVAPYLTTPRVALLGKPNAGKSSLFNALVSDTAAIVSPEAGTTRDALSGRWLLPNGCEVELLDTPGLRDRAETVSHAEAAGIQTAMREVSGVALRLVLAPFNQPRPLVEGLHVATMLDLGKVPHWADIAVSARERIGLAELGAAVSGHLYPPLPKRLLPLSSAMAADATSATFTQRWF